MFDLDSRRPNGQQPESFDTIFDTLRRARRATRTTLVARTGLSKATVSEATAALLRAGFVREVGKVNHGRGRSQTMLELVPEAR